MTSSRSSSRPTTASTTSNVSFSSGPPTDLEREMSMCQKDGKSKFDIWNTIKRPMTSNAYHLTARYRMCSAPIRRVKSGVINRRRRKESQSTNDADDSNRSLTTAMDLYDFDKDFLEDFDFDADDETDSTKCSSGPVAHSQGVYLRACKRLDVSPNSYVFRNLINDHLQLKHHLLGPDGVKPIAIALIENSSVTSLDLEDNGLGLAGVQHIGATYLENTFISDLNLAQNELKSEGTRLILEKLKECDVVQKLNLSGNNLQEYDGELFQDYIEETRNLKELRLSHNCFRGLGGMALGECLMWNETIEKVDLSWNHLRANGARAIAKAIASNTSIKHLNVSWNGFYLDGSKEMAQALLKNSTLLYLDMSSNRINKQCLQELVKGLKGNTTLRVIRLGDNPITSAGAFFLASQVFEMTNSGLKEIDLGHQSVEPNFLELLEKIREMRPSLEIRFGAVLGQDGQARDDEQDLMDENPVVVLMEFGNLLGYRLFDLFAMMDKDNSKTLTRMEIKNGLLGCNIPLSEKALDNMVEKLDEDGDGEIDYGELIAGRKKHRRKMNRAIVLTRETNGDMEDTEVGRVRMKLKKLMDKQQEENRHRVGVSTKAAPNGDVKTSHKGGDASPRSGNMTSATLKDTFEVARTGATSEQEEGQSLTSGLVSALPRPTEVGATIALPKLKKGSLFSNLMA